MDHQPGAEVWINLNGDFRPAIVVEQEPLQVQLEEDSGKPFFITPRECFPRAAHSSPVSDCCSLTYLDEANILWNLKERYARDDIYTSVSAVLFSVNPYKPVPHYYTAELQRKYWSDPHQKPHPYGLASLAYYRMMRDREPHAILISGESGSGKTEASKFVMEFLGERSKEGEKMKEKVVHGINPLLEAFGNATTVRNDNSSRFGKLHTLLFHAKGTLLGSRIQVFLLENNRVVHYGKNERTYHVFYEMFFHPEAEKWFLEKKKKYKLLGRLERKPRDDKANFGTLMRAFEALQIDSLEIFQILAALLHLGEIQFEENNENNENEAFIVDAVPLQHAASLLGCDEERFRKVLLTKTIMVPQRGSAYVTKFTKNQAEHALASLMKSIYKRLFDVLVSRINLTSPESDLTIGILDIYGFEQLEQNSLEQFCINLANEALQEHFITNCIEAEQNAYLNEGLPWKSLTFPQNKPVVDMIKRVFVTLDQHGRLQAKNQPTTDERLTQDIVNIGKGSTILTEPKRRAKVEVSMGFIVTHYAGQVKYDTASWLDKNNARMSVDLEGLLASCSHRMVKTFAEVDASNAFSSVCTKYLEDLKKLLRTITQGKLHYIRCFKPNDSQRPNAFDTRRVLDQMIQSGTTHLVNVMHHGWPCRVHFDTLHRFRDLLPADFASMDNRCFIEALLLAFGVSRTDFCFGTSKLFMKSGKMDVLEQLKKSGGKADEAVLRTVLRYIRRKKLARCMQALGFVLWIKKELLARRQRRIDASCKALRYAVRTMCRLRHALLRARSRIKQRNADSGRRKLRMAWKLWMIKKLWLAKAREAISRKQKKRLLCAWVCGGMFWIHLRRRRTNDASVVQKVQMRAIEQQQKLDFARAENRELPFERESVNSMLSRELPLDRDRDFNSLRTKHLVAMFKNYALCVIYLKRWARRRKNARCKLRKDASDIMHKPSRLKQPLKTSYLTPKSHTETVTKTNTSRVVAQKVAPEKKIKGEPGRLQERQREILRSNEGLRSNERTREISRSNERTNEGLRSNERLRSDERAWARLRTNERVRSNERTKEMLRSNERSNEGLRSNERTKEILRANERTNEGLRSNTRLRSNNNKPNTVSRMRNTDRSNSRTPRINAERTGRSNTERRTRDNDYSSPPRKRLRTSLDSLHRTSLAIRDSITWAAQKLFGITIPEKPREASPRSDFSSILNAYVTRRMNMMAGVGNHEIPFASNVRKPGWAAARRSRA